MQQAPPASVSVSIRQGIEACLLTPPHQVNGIVFFLLFQEMTEQLADTGTGASASRRFDNHKSPDPCQSPIQDLADASYISRHRGDSVSVATLVYPLCNLVQIVADSPEFGTNADQIIMKMWPASTHIQSSLPKE
nr:hypothetical protein [Gluconacetobacter tumulicola]